MTNRSDQSSTREANGNQRQTLDSSVDYVERKGELTLRLRRKEGEERKMNNLKPQTRQELNQHGNIEIMREENVHRPP
jgi:hypothetical protein